MASNPNFLLTPQQQELLFAALNANRFAPTANGDLTVAPNAVSNPVAAAKPAAITSSLDDGSFLDYDYAFEGDTSLDYSLNDASNFIEDPAEGDDTKTESAPSNDGNESPDKRSHPDDEDDETNDSKRREGSEKVAKKPGRKPLTSEPVSKRKAQNRAAQRAFRERKEKHLKDLEDKVAELEKASEAANSENSVLRAQVDKMSVELSEYKKRMTLISKTKTSPVQAGHQVFGNPIFNSINDVNFQFEFPKFGQLPGPSDPTGSAVNSSSNSSNARLASNNRVSSLDTLGSPSTELPGLSTASTSVVNSPASQTNGAKKGSPKDDLSKLSNAFTPPAPNGNAANTGRGSGSGSMDSGCTSSPSASSHSNTAPSSSCGTSPEPYSQSPMGFKPVDTLTTIGEEPATAAHMATTTADFPHLANVDMNDMSWLNSQTSFRFDPQLFGDYRDPQENVLASGGFDDSFFNDALDVDFVTPYNTALSPIGAQKPGSLIAQIDAAKEGEFLSSSLATPEAKAAAAAAAAAATVTMPLSASGQMLTCNKIWEHLQNCPKVQNGDFDLDGLCSDLQKKAKCSGSGAVVNETDFKNVMKKYLDKDQDGGADCSTKFIAGITGSKA